WTVSRAAELRAIGADGMRVFSNHFSLAQMVFPPWPGCLALSADDLREVGELGMTVLAWSSLARGFFAGNDTPEWGTPDNRARRVRAEQLAAARGCSATAVAPAYVTDHGDHCH